MHVVRMCAMCRLMEMAHSVEEEVHQPQLLRCPPGGSLRPYQMDGLRWMVSLYNNHLNGILADEVGGGHRWGGMVRGGRWGQPAYLDSSLVPFGGGGEDAFS